MSLKIKTRLTTEDSIEDLSLLHPRRTFLRSEDIKMMEVACVLVINEVKSTQ